MQLPSTQVPLDLISQLDNIAQLSVVEGLAHHKGTEAVNKRLSCTIQPRNIKVKLRIRREEVFAPCEKGLWHAFSMNHRWKGSQMETNWKTAGF